MENNRWELCGHNSTADIARTLLASSRFWRCAEGVLKAGEEIGKHQISRKTTYGTFLKISKHELR